MNEKKTAFLEIFLLKCGIAESNYYFNMKKEVFDKAMKGNEEEVFYKELINKIIEVLL